MTATFRGVPFSITSTRKIYSKYIEGFKPEMDESLATQKTFLFLKNMRLDERQKEVLEKSEIPYIIFDQSYQDFSEKISEGMPPGSLMIGDNTYEMGFTFDIDNAISTNWMELRKLVAGWRYAKPDVRRLPLASLVQQRGRVGRKKEGTWITLSKETKEVEPTEDASTLMLRCCLSGDTTELKGAGYTSLTDINFIRNAVALPDKFGRYPEEILIGMGGYVANPTFENEPKQPPAGGWGQHPLWRKHIGTWEPASLVVEKAKKWMELMVDTFITKQKNILREIKIDFESAFVKAVGWLDDTIKTTEAEKEVRKILNTTIDNKIKEIIKKDKEYDRREMKSTNRQTVRDIADLYKLSADVEIKIYENKKKEKGKKEEKIIPTLKIVYKKAEE